MFPYLESGSGLFEGIPPDFPPGGMDPLSSAFALLIIRALAFVRAENLVPSGPGFVKLLQKISIKKKYTRKNRNIYTYNSNIIKQILFYIIYLMPRKPDFCSILPFLGNDSFHWRRKILTFSMYLLS